MMPLRLTILVLMLAAGGAGAQPMSGEVQPDRLSFGIVHTGATVEGSFMVLQRGKDKGIKFEVANPKRVMVIKKSIDTQQYGPGNDYVRVSVEIAIDTSAEGEVHGDLAVTLGQQTVKVPIRAMVKARRVGLLRMLVAETPFQRFSTKDGRMFDAWTELVKDSAWDVSYLLTTRGKPALRDLDLAQFDAILLGHDSLFALTPEDVKRVRAFAEAGGRVLVAANYFFRGTVPQANAVLAGYGLELQDTEAKVIGQNRVTLGKDDLDPQLVKAGIATAHFFRASPVKVTAGERGRVLAKAVGVGNPGDGFAAIARAGKGEVVALGESLWDFWITPEQNPSGGNTKLLRWLLASGHQRRQRLARLARPLTAAEVERHWRGLGDADPEAAAEALGYLASAPAADREVVPFLRKHVKAVPPSDDKRLGQLITDLDNDEFAVRERAQRELERMGEEAVPALRKALAGKPALEVRRRIESILKKPRTLSPEMLQVVRAVEVLENIGTPEARELLKSLADGVPEAVLTQEAKASLERLARRPAVKP
jgi:hypothetical protein